MTEQKQTGNPVFDFRADYRASAEKLQHRLLISGVVLFVACGIAALVVDFTSNTRLITALASMGGLVLLISSLVWGFYWRKKLRDEFRETYKV